MKKTYAVPTALRKFCTTVPRTSVLGSTIPPLRGWFGTVWNQL